MFIRRKFLGQTRAVEGADIRDNLRHLLTTKRGMGYFLPDFGVTDTGARSASEMVEHLSREVTENIVRFEPRVEVVEIEDDYLDDGSLRLTVKCRQRNNGKPHHIVLGPRGSLIGIDDGEQDFEDAR